MNYKKVTYGVIFFTFRYVHWPIIIDNALNMITSKHSWCWRLILLVIFTVADEKKMILS
jgi:hypothetical protein